MQLKKIILPLIAILIVGENTMASYLQKAKWAFDKLDKNNLNVVEEFYDKNAKFQDPIHFISGTKAIRAYYEGLYKNVDSIRFEYKRTSEVGELVTLEWKMYLTSPSLNNGNEITLDGVSIITFDGKEGKVVMHRDYFDMGEFIYEKLPVLNRVISFIKKRMMGNS